MMKMWKWYLLLGKKILEKTGLEVNTKNVNVTNI